MESQVKKPYKVLLESVIEPQKNLQLTGTYNTQAPPGYTFVAIGVPDFTKQCRELSIQRQVKVFAVSEKPKSVAQTNPENISYHLARVGHHFENGVVDDVMRKFVRRTERREAAQVKTVESTGSYANASRRALSASRSDIPAALAARRQHDRQIEATIKELFPKIPNADLVAIVERAWAKGTDRVGNAPGVTLSRRVQLAVLAHIRHKYTHYDDHLKLISWSEARKIVERPCLAQLLKWRGEDKQDGQEAEEYIREVIILDDDEEPESESPALRDSSVEVVSTRRTKRRLPSLDSSPDAHDQAYSAAYHPANNNLHTTTAALIEGPLHMPDPSRHIHSVRLPQDADLSYGSVSAYDGYVRKRAKVQEFDRGRIAARAYTPVASVNQADYARSHIDDPNPSGPVLIDLTKPTRPIFPSHQPLTSTLMDFDWGHRTLQGPITRNNTAQLPNDRERYRSINEPSDPSGILPGRLSYPPAAHQDRPLQGHPYGAVTVTNNIAKVRASIEHNKPHGQTLPHRSNLMSFFSNAQLRRAANFWTNSAQG